MMSVDLVAQRLGGQRLASGGYICRCPVPSHGAGKGDRRPSLSVTEGDIGLLVHCFAGCSPGDVLEELGRLDLVDRERETASQQPRPRQTVEAGSRAASILEEALPIEGTLAERYLTEHRGLSGPFLPSLRYTPSLLYSPRGPRLPALLALVHAPDGTVIGVQATFLRAIDGSKAHVSSPRLTFGSLSDGAVRTAMAGTIMGVAEGTENALAATELTGCPCWASLGAARLHRVAFPDSVRELHIFADDDDPGRRASARTAAVHQARGLRVVERLPPKPARDWAEVISASGFARSA